MIRHVIRLGLAAALVLGAAIAGAAESGSSAKTAPVQEARIPFAALGGINNWVADGEKALYIEGLRHQWYHAKLMGTCLDLPFVERIGFVMEPDQSFDKFSAIVVRGHVCQVISMVKSERPSTLPKLAKAEDSGTK
jgi:hypothetical protein